MREYLDNGNVRFIAVGGEPGQISFTYCLAASASDSRHLTFFTKDNMSEITQWQAIPIGEYELVDLQYVRTTVDDFDLEMAICDVDEYNNNTSNEVTWTYSLSIPFTETSNFSTTEGVTVNVSSGLSVGVPNILGSGASISYDTSIQQQSSHSYTFGESTQTTITKTRTVQVPVAPHSKVKMETTLFTYKGTLTYVATLRKIGTNTTFRIKGRWSGNCFSKFVGNVYDVTTTQLLKTYELNE